MVKEKTLKSRHFNAICLWEHSGFTGKTGKIRGKFEKSGKTQGKFLKFTL